MTNPSPSTAAEPSALPPRKESSAPPQLHAPNVHEEVTVARDLPEITAFLSSLKDPLAQTETDVSPFGATEQAPAREAPGAAGSISDRPTALPAEPVVVPPPREASPLSQSVAAPEARASAPNAGADAESAKPSGVDVGRVVSVGDVSPEPPAPPPPAAAAPARPAPNAPALRTMMGMPASSLPLSPPGRDGALAAEGRAPAPHNAARTMMGVAIPGIAPLQAGGGAPPAPAPAPGFPPPPGAAPDLRSHQSTMLGIAIPGIAPSHPSAGHGTPPAYVPSQVQNTSLGMMAAPDLPIVPRPKTLIDEPLPAAPVLPPKQGIPALAVVGILIGVVAVLGGVGAFFALRSGAPLSAVPQLDENGRESLKIGCVSCPDGTKVSLGASTATVTASAAVLPLPAPLSIGENDLGVKIDRPGAGRDEEVKIHVPVAYRVRADLSTLAARPPAITVRVEAVAGSEVKVEDHPVTLDATGRGAYAIDLTKETEGAGEARTFERKIPFVIAPKGGKSENGQLTARTGIVALALDAPGAQLFTEQPTAAVTGQTRQGATITIDGQSVAVDAQGRFGVRVELASVGDKPLEIVASAPPLAPRIVKAHVVRVPSLAATAKELEADKPLAFADFSADPASKAGQKAVVEGEIVEIRAAGGHTVMLVSSRGCAEGAACLVRVVHGEEDKLARGAVVRAYGRVLGSVTASGKTVPELEGSLVLPVKAPK